MTRAPELHGAVTRRTTSGVGAASVAMGTAVLVVDDLIDAGELENGEAPVLGWRL